MKNIVIVILLLLNGFLLSLALTQRIQRARSIAAAWDSAVEILRSGGIVLADEVSPCKMKLSIMQAGRDLEAEEQAARELLGEELQVEIRGGVYRYQGENGAIQFHSTGEFQAQIEPGSFPLNGKTAENHGAQVLEKLGIQAQVVSDRVYGGNGSITFRQTLGGVPILGCRATLTYTDGALTSISNGCRMAGTPEKSGRPAQVEPATVLMGFYHSIGKQGDACGEIRQIDPAYEYNVSLTGGIRLIPVWYVRTDGGQYQMDVRGSTLTPVTDETTFAMIMD